IMAHTDFAVHAPTLELTVQFRTDPRTLEMSDDAYCVAVFRQLSGREGFIDETGEIWSPDGQLLVLSRQLAVLLPRSDDMVGKWEFVGPQFRGRS
ncbi:MAG: thioesterase family protein, partial [Acidimicrobiales bacterium]|nr:thioesterase family protein [Acidimicrobiales bacterium]